MEGDELRFFDPYGETERSWNRVPHWQQAGATYFVTFRLADSVPSVLVEELEERKREWLDKNPKPWSDEKEIEYHRKFSGLVESWLDEGRGSCLLRSPENAIELKRVFLKCDGERYHLVSFVVMPNHVHVLFVLNREFELAGEVKAWKGISARRINRNEKRGGPLWQKSYFDRLVRDLDHFQNCIRYIRRNPGKAGLSESQYLLYESELARMVL